MEILKRDVTAKSYPIIFGYRFGNMPPSATWEWEGRDGGVAQVVKCMRPWGQTPASTNKN
jgi:hypothetical protein